MCFEDDAGKKPCGMRIKMDDNDLCRSFGCEHKECVVAAALRCKVGGVDIRGS